MPPGASAPMDACSRSAPRAARSACSTCSPARVRRFTGGKPAAVLRLAFTPDRRTLVTSHDDGRLLVWDVNTGKPIGTALTVESDTYAAAVLAPDGSRLFAVSDRQSGVR